MSESHRIRREAPVAEKVGGRDLSLSGARWFGGEVTGKVGSV